MFVHLINTHLKLTGMGDIFHISYETLLLLLFNFDRSFWKTNQFPDEYNSSYV